MTRGIAWMLAMATLGAGPAFAQQPVNPYDEPVLAPAPGVPAPAPIITAPAPEPINPYTLTPPPPSYPAPPVYAPPPPPAYPPPPPAPPRQGYYVYPQPGAPPVYYVPAPRPVCCHCPPRAWGAYGCRTAAPYVVRRLPPPPAVVPQVPREWVRRFSLGVHGVVFGINQNVGTNNVLMGGAGLQLRFRSAGRFGFELATSYLQTDNFWNGNWQRKSLPFTAGIMLYIFPNSDARHFNIYGIAGVGAMYDMINLRDENNAKVEQDFLEWMAFGGAGLELRWKWFAISADYRFNGMWRDNGSTPASYYNGVSGAPVPSSSYGHLGKANITFWF